MFAYCLNDPVNKADTGGTIPEWAVKMLVGTAVIAAAGVFTLATAGTVLRLPVSQSELYRDLSPVH